MKEIKATAPTPQDWIELVRENERLKGEVSNLKRHIGNLASYIKELTNENECLKQSANHLRWIIKDLRVEIDWLNDTARDDND